jgi:predicted TPR repeat methyltransferase
MNTSSDKRDFNKEAATWDENPARVKLADDVANAILANVRLPEDAHALDFGCGTGLLTLRLRPHVRSIVGADTSEGMLEVLNAKVAAHGLTGVQTQLIDTDRGGALTGTYGLVASAMTLHHVPELAPLFADFFRITTPGGYLCIADLDSEGGEFHADNHGVFHFGFDRAQLRALLEETGYEDIRDTTAAEICKPASNGELRAFTVFLITARKPTREEF